MTLLLCGPLLLLPAEAASAVFIQMSISAAMVAALANVKPYLQSSDGTLAQMCQAALTFTMSVGLLEMAAESFQDAYYGPILVVCTTAQFAVGFIAVGFEWALNQFPEMFRKAGRLIGLSSSDPQNDIIAPRRLKNSFLRKTKVNAVAPVRSSAPNPKEEGTANPSEENRDAVVVLCVDNEEVSTEQSAVSGPPAGPTKGSAEGMEEDLNDRSRSLVSRKTGL